MLFYPMGKVKPVRIQGAFVTDKEVENIVDFIKDGGEASYDSDVIDKLHRPFQAETVTKVKKKTNTLTKPLSLL